MRLGALKNWHRVVLGLVVLLGLAAYVVPKLLYPVHPSPEQLALAMKEQSVLQGPARVWTATCAHCHAPAEGAPIGPPLAGRQMPAAAIQVIVRNGLRSMPAFPPSQISDQELQALAEYVQQMPADAVPTQP